MIYNSRIEGLLTYFFNGFSSSFPLIWSFRPLPENCSCDSHRQHPPGQTQLPALCRRPAQTFSSVGDGWPHTPEAQSSPDAWLPALSRFLLSSLASSLSRVVCPPRRDPSFLSLLRLST